MTRIKDITTHLEKLAPLAYQESYDNVGLLIGSSDTLVTGVLITLDVTEAVVQEAIDRGCNVIIAHHPIIFKGLKKLNGRNYVERTAILAIKNDVAIYASHTNLDHVVNGVNYRLAEAIGLQNVRILSPKKQWLKKLVSFVPLADTQTVLDALYEAGAGTIGKYTNCSFRSEGTGTFMPTEAANPYVGERNKLEEVKENRIELIFPSYLESDILKALRKAHPYEEVAYYLSVLENENQEVGAGAIGDLPVEMDTRAFLGHLKEKLNLSCIRYTDFSKQTVRRVAVCGGVGSFLLFDAIRQGADAFVTADFKYHQFFDAEGRIMIADIGHYESEVFTKDLICAYLSERFANIALILSNTLTNPINYF